MHSTVSTFLAVTIAEYTAQAPGNPVDVFATASWSTSSASIGPVTGSFSNESLVTFAYLVNPQAITGAEGTVRLNGIGYTGVLEDRVIASPTPSTASWTNNASGGNGMTVLVKSTTSVGGFVPQVGGFFVGI